MTLEMRSGASLERVTGRSAVAAGPRDHGMQPGWSRWLFSWGLLFLAFFSCCVAAISGHFPADRTLALAIQEVDLNRYESGLVSSINWLGKTEVFIVLTLVLSAVFAASRSWWAAGLVLYTFVPRVANGLLKLAAERPRPAGDAIDVSYDATGFSFPSGHAAGAAALFGTLFFVIPFFVSWRPLRWTLQAACLLAALGAGPARIYYGVHWPSDVIAGYLLAGLMMMPAFAILRSPGTAGEGAHRLRGVRA